MCSLSALLLAFSVYLGEKLIQILSLFFVCLFVLSSFEGFVCFFFHLVVWVPYVFCILTPYKIQDLQMPSPILKATFLHFIIWCVCVPWHTRRTHNGQRTTRIGSSYLEVDTGDWTPVTLEQAPKAALYIILLFPCGILLAPCYSTCLLFHLSLLWDSYPQSLPRPDSLFLCFPPDPQCQALINWELVFMCGLGV